MGLELLLVYNDRARGNSRIDREDTVYRAEPGALEDLVGHEWGLNYRVRGRHAGQDPLLFLDLRNTRGWVKDNSAGKSVPKPVRLYLRRRFERGSRRRTRGVQPGFCRGQPGGGA